MTAQRGGSGEAAAAPAWSVYLARSRDGALYTGIATDVARRLEEHRRGGRRGARSLRGRGPIELVLAVAIGERGLALRVEALIKKLPKGHKEALAVDPGLVEPLVARARGRAPGPRLA